MPGPWDKFKQSAPSESGPWAKFGAKTESVPVEPSVSGETMAEAALQGLGQGGAAGYLPQWQAITEGLLPDPNKDLDEELAAQGFKVEKPKDDYLSRRDYFLKREERLKEQAPGSYYGGLIGGSIGGGGITTKALSKLPAVGGLMTASKDAGLLRRIGTAGLGGAAQGFIQNPGDELGKGDPYQVEQRLENARLGGLIGGAAQTGVEAVSAGAKALKSIPAKLKSYGETKAFKAAGAMLKDFRKAEGKNRVNELGAEMLESGILKPGDTFEDIASKSLDAKKDVGGKIGEIYDRLQSSGRIRVDPSKVTSELLDAVIDPKVMPRTGKEAYGNAMFQIIEDIERTGADLADPRVLNDIIGELDTKINYSKRTNELPVIQQGYKAMRQKLRSSLNSMVDEYGKMSGDPTLGESLKQLNKRYGNVTEINSIARDRVSRENANRFLSLTDTIVGTGGAAIGAQKGYESGGVEGALKGAAIGAGAGLLNKGARLYGVPLVAKGASSLGKLGSKLPPGVPSLLESATSSFVKNPQVTGAAASGLLNKKGLIGKERK